jgi:RimJ/RimL family protein N-acetyltransferase
MTSRRLCYRAVSADDAGEFHALVTDEYVRRYLMDGKVVPRAWTEQQVSASQDLFTRRGVGLWLASEATTGELVGFCGFLEVPLMLDEPQLVYALLERWSGQGYGTEMARAALIEARSQPGFERVFARVDQVNHASCSVLDKLGFEVVDVLDGAFGPLLLCRAGPVRATASPQVQGSAKAT